MYVHAACRILAVIALVLFLLVTGSGGAFAGGGVLVLIATALGITSFIMTRSPPAAGTDVVPIGAASNSNRPSTQQAPMAELVVGQPQFSPTAAVTQSKPDVQPVPAGVTVGLPMSSPVAVPVAANNQEGKQQSAPELVPIGNPQPQSQPAVAGQGTVIRPRDQLPMPQAHVMQPNPQYGAVQSQEPLAPLPHPQGTIKPEKQQTGIGGQVFKKGAEFAVESLVDTLLSGNTDPLAMAGNGIISSMAAAAVGGDAGAADSGDATC